jgi:drug/metabolite transporter (DMT)-like permease
MPVIDSRAVTMRLMVCRCQQALAAIWNLANIRGPNFRICTIRNYSRPASRSHPSRLFNCPEGQIHGMRWKDSGALSMDRATWLGGLALLLWALLALLSRAAASLPPFQLAAMTFAVSGGLGLTWLWAMRRLRVPPLAWLHGVGGLFGYHALFFAAMARAPAAEANLLNYTWPLLIVLLSAPLLGLRLTVRHLLGVITGLSGSFLLLAQGTSFTVGAVLGYVCAVGAALTWALYSVLARRMRTVPTEAVIGFCAVSSILAAGAHILFESTVVPDRETVFAVVALGLGPVGAAFLLWDIAMKRGDPRLLGSLAYATPVASTIILGLAGFAPLSLSTVAATLLVVAGGWIATSAFR